MQDKSLRSLADEVTGYTWTHQGKDTAGFRQGSVHNKENHSASPVVPLKAGSIVPYEDVDLITITGLKGLIVGLLSPSPRWLHQHLEAFGS